MAALLALTASMPWLTSLQAESTRRWKQSRLESFEKGTADKTSIRSDGKLSLAPLFREIYDAPASYLWALASDSRGNLFAGGGPSASVFRIGSDGRKSTLFDADAVEIHALVVDRQDHIYAATSPDAKVYKIDPSGGHSVFFDPGGAYIWSMAFDSKGNLYLATGDQGLIYRVTPEGQGSVFFDTGETHVRSILVDGDDNLIAGTDPSGLILRVSAASEDEAKGFVLYQSSKKEITTLAQGADGAIYAAGVGNRAKTPPPGTGSRVTVTTSAPPPAVAAPSLRGRRQPVTQRPAIPLPPSAAISTRLVGGSEVYRIEPDGEPRKVWTSKTDIVYSLALDPDDRLLIGTGDQGRLVRLESETLHSLVLTTASSQITAMAPGQDGKVLVATSNIGKIYELGPGLETEGHFESEVFDASIFSKWGRLEWQGSTPSSSRIEVSTRSGNLNSPTRNWSEWSEPIVSPEGGSPASPASRFVQWRAVLQAADDGTSPTLDSVSLYYLRKNSRPVITELEATPPNYEFTKAPGGAPSQNITLRPLGRTPNRRTVSATPVRGLSMKPAQGKTGVRWLARDPNDDKLVFKVEIRGVGEQSWKLLEEDVETQHLGWDSTSFADGRYRVRVTASDAPSNPSSEAETDSRVSEPFVIDNTAPAIRDLAATWEEGRLRVQFEALDTVTKIEQAQYSLDGGDWEPILPDSRLFDSKELSFDFRTAPVKPGEHTVAVRVRDPHKNLAVAKALVN